MTTRNDGVSCGASKSAGPLFSTLDHHFGRFLESLGTGPDTLVSLTGRLVSAHTRMGHVCLDLRQFAGRPVTAEMGGGDLGDPTPRYPSLADWMDQLWKRPVVGSPGAFRPLILDNTGRLYLHRYWQYEARLAERIAILAREPAPEVDSHRFRAEMDRLFTGQEPTHGPDWQKIACAVANLKRFCVISGGPGTGKTSTVIKILALMIAQHQAAGHETPLRIVMAAPTGKAAARLSEAVNRAKSAIVCDPEVQAGLPSAAATVHRILGTISGTPYFRHHETHPLVADVIVVDEASMVDLALMAKLVAAIPRTGRLILLGDMDQLASVEAGAVLGDICGPEIPNQYGPWMTERLHRLTGESLPESAKTLGSLSDCRVQLRKSYRFADSGMIAELSRAVNRGAALEAIAMLSSPWENTVVYRPRVSAEDFSDRLRERILEGYAPVLRQSDPARALDLLGRFRILCAVNFGPLGVSGINRFSERVLFETGCIAGGLSSGDFGRDSAGPGWYRGRPVLMLRNDYRLQIFNGDVGITLPDPDDPQGPLWVFFPGEGGRIRKFPPEQLPEPETVFAMTVHKSQGSEFDRVLFILPDRSYPVLSRELVYTAITRAVHQVEIWSDPAVFEAAIQNRVRRHSGLGEALWGVVGSSPL